MAFDPERASSEIRDRLDITQLVLRCALSLDTSNWQLLATCFTVDAVETFSTGERAGYEAIEQLCRLALARWTGPSTSCRT